MLSEQIKRHPRSRTWLVERKDTNFYLLNLMYVEYRRKRHLHFKDFRGSSDLRGLEVGGRVQ